MFVGHIIFYYFVMVTIVANAASLCTPVAYDQSGPCQDGTALGKRNNGLSSRCLGRRFCREDALLDISLAGLNGGELAAQSVVAEREPGYLSSPLEPS
jgi:hypothetical protein